MDGNGPEIRSVRHSSQDGSDLLDQRGKTGHRQKDRVLRLDFLPKLIPFIAP